MVLPLGSVGFLSTVLSGLIVDLFNAVEGIVRELSGEDVGLLEEGVEGGLSAEDTLRA
jgi:hypothetical protein